MDKTYKLSWVDQILIFVFASIILTLYHLCNVYIMNLSELTVIIDVFAILISFPIYTLVLVMIDYNELTLTKYQISKFIFVFFIILNGISLLNYLLNSQGLNLFIISTVIYFALILFLFIMKFSPVLHGLRMKNTITKTIKKEQLKRTNIKNKFKIKSKFKINLK